MNENETPMSDLVVVCKVSTLILCEERVIDHLHASFFFPHQKKSTNIGFFCHINSIKL